MTGPADGWLDRDGISIHYLEWNADPAPRPGRPILLLHGLSSNAHYWDRVARHLSPAGPRIVALDQRGHGLTGRPPHAPPVPDGYAMERLIDDAAFAIESLGLDHPVIAGHSWGATVSLETAARLGDAISALVFIDGPIEGFANWFSWDEAQQFMQPPLPRYTSFAQAVDDVRRDFDGAWGDDLEPFVMSRLVQDGSDLVLTLTAPIRLELLRGLFESPVDHLWTVLDAPAAVLLAKQGPAAITSRREGGAKALAKAAPGVEVRWFDTPHDIPVFEPEAIARELARFSGSDPAAAQKLQD